MPTIKKKLWKCESFSFFCLFPVVLIDTISIWKSYNYMYELNSCCFISLTQTFYRDFHLSLNAMQFIHSMQYILSMCICFVYLIKSIVCWLYISFDHTQFWSPHFCFILRHCCNIYIEMNFCAVVCSKENRIN